MAAPEIDVRYTAKLARLNLSEEEIETFGAQLGQVLEYIRQLEEVDIEGVEPMAHTHPVFNVLREDEARDWFAPQEALANAPREASGLFIVPKVIE